MTLDCTVLSTNADRDTVLENKQQATLVHEVVPFFAIQCCMYVNAFCGQKNLLLVTKSTKTWTICLKTLLTTYDRPINGILSMKQFSLDFCPFWVTNKGCLESWVGDGDHSV